MLREQQLQRDLAVSELPNEILERSYDALNKELQQSITAISTGILIRDKIGSTGIISRNTPYQIECSPVLGVFITVSDSDFLLNYVGYRDRLPFNEFSVAGEKLIALLCKKTAEYMFNVTTSTEVLSTPQDSIKCK